MNKASLPLILLFFQGQGYKASTDVPLVFFSQTEAWIGLLQQILMWILLKESSHRRILAIGKHPTVRTQTHPQDRGLGLSNILPVQQTSHSLKYKVVAHQESTMGSFKCGSLIKHGSYPFKSFSWLQITKFRKSTRRITK